MGKSIVFDLGPAVGLTSRTLVIYNVGVHPRTTLATPAVAASDVTATADIDDNLMCEAVLTDVRGSSTSSHRSLRFTTRPLVDYPGPSNFQHGEGILRIVSMEDTSSSSSSSSLSSSSSSSSSSLSSSSSVSSSSSTSSLSSSSSSASSQSSSSTSSLSSSSSSISTSSSSSSSSNSSSSSSS